jgi:Tfp pilus assembly protein PilF
MTFSSSWRRTMVLVALLVGVAGLGVGGYFLWKKLRGPDLPAPGTPRYQKYVKDFQVGVAALDVSLPDRAEENLSRAIERVPDEPAAWANRGLAYLRTNQFKKAARDLKRAQKLAPNNSNIEFMLGLLARKQGKFPEAVAHFRKALEQGPDDPEARFSLAQLVAQQKGPDADAESLRLLKGLLKLEPNNLIVLKETAGAALRSGDQETFRYILRRFNQLASGWSSQSREQLEALETTAARGNRRRTLGELAILDNVLKREAGYTRDYRVVSSATGLEGRPLYQFLSLANPKTMPAEPDLGLRFEARPLVAQVTKILPASRWEVLQPVWLVAEKKPAVYVANGREVRRADSDANPLPFPGGKDHVPSTSQGTVALDWKNSFRNNLLLAGAGGLRFWEQGRDGEFKDVTARTELKSDLVRGNYLGAWAVDYDMDGFLDIILAPRKGPPLVLRNRGDGRFQARRPFPGVRDVRAFAWADLDNDGAPDAALVDARGKLHVFANQRSGQFRRRPSPDLSGKALALAVGDLNDDGVLDLAVLRADGAVVRVSDRDKGKAWEVAEVARWPDFPANPEPGSFRLFFADLDNNGGLDLVACGPKGTRVWMRDPQGKLQLLSASPEAKVFAAVDWTGNGRLDLLGLSRAGQPVRLVNRGTKNYSWQPVLTRADDKAKGDQRINSFAAGSEVEVRTGTLVQKQMTTSPVTHFGLGEHKQVDFVRIVWPNGNAQVEFSPPPNRVVRAAQRLSGSCPYLFTYDGRRMTFVKDFMWSTPLGMYIGGQAKGDFQQTTEWVKIRGDQLVPRRGYYDVRVHANLWETHYDDYLALVAVDHPRGTEIFVDESFPLTRKKPQVHVMEKPRPVWRAWDDRGKDVTSLVRAVDGRYLDTFGLGRFQGVTRDHWVEVDLGKAAPKKGPVWLVAHGWLQPTDSSINYALEQGNHDRPRPLVLEVPDGRGGWRVARADIGFPAGKNKTVLVRLDGIAGKGVARRFRLRTNMEIYWDALHYARGLDGRLASKKWLKPSKADLRYRGFVEMTRANRSSPELPHYDKLVGTNQRWRDQVGYFTRYGDVRQLLARTDDRYVIMNAGDEIALRFPVPAGPRRGWKRDFLWVSDGWTKDGNLNTRFSKTVLPLPFHAQKTYDRPPGRLEDDPVYRRFPGDWLKFHTRYVTPDDFGRGLRPQPRPPR